MVPEFSEETCGNGVQIDFELSSLEWIQTQEKPTYHGWPTLANVGNDKLVIVCSGDREAHVDPYGKVLMYESCDKGKTWSAPTILANGPLDDRDAGIMVTPAGTWLVNYFTSMAFSAFKTEENTPPAGRRSKIRSLFHFSKRNMDFSCSAPPIRERPGVPNTASVSTMSTVPSFLMTVLFFIAAGRGTEAV